MKKKYLIHDYLNKFSLENPYSFSSSIYSRKGYRRNQIPKLKKFIITSNLDNKSIIQNIGSVISSSGGQDINKNSSLSIELLKLFILFSRIFGQTPKILKAHKSVASWNVREGMNSGVLITLQSNNKFFKNFEINKFLLFILPLLNQKDTLLFLNPLTRISSSRKWEEKKIDFEIEISNIGNLIFGISSLNIFNPIFPDIEYYEYSNIINDIKNSSEFIGCRINIVCQYPSLKTSTFTNWRIGNKKIFPKEQDKQNFILSYYQFPI